MSKATTQSSVTCQQVFDHLFRFISLFTGVLLLYYINPSYILKKFSKSKWKYKKNPAKRLDSFEIN